MDLSISNDAMIVAITGLSVLVLATAAWFRLARRVAIPNNRIIFLSSWGIAAILGISSFFLPGSGWLSGIFGALATAGGAGLLVLYLLRKQGAGDVISVGDQIPVFTAADDKGAIFDAATLKGSPLLIKFFRGHW